MKEIAEPLEIGRRVDKPFVFRAVCAKKLEIGGIGADREIERAD